MMGEHTHEWRNATLVSSPVNPQSRTIAVQECACGRLRIEVVSVKTGKSCVGFMRFRGAI